MKKKYCLLLSVTIMICLFAAGCDKAKEPVAPTDTPEPDVTASAEEQNDTQDAVQKIDVIDDTIPKDIVSEDPASADAVSEDAVSDNALTEETQEDDNTKDAESAGSLSTIVWLGDSLTQGSLGEDNDNLANAPYVKLQSLVPNKVEGYGLYGYNTHDIFWVYKDEDHYDQTVDPNKIYIFWVGSNDWCPIDGENTNTAPVIAEIDSLLQSGGVKDYIVMGTTQRWRLGLERAQIINAALSAHYGSHYMDVIDIIARNGFSEDNTHLSQASYDAIAEAVYGKLKALGYI